jgi:hypothetical protein
VWRGRRRRFGLGLATVFGLRQRGFFIPSRHAAVTSPPFLYTALEPAFRQAEPNFFVLLAVMERHAPALLAIGEEPPPAPRWRQDWFPRLDAAAAYALVSTRAPKRLIEIGSGHSTRWLARAVADAGLPTRIVAIDPAPRASLIGLRLEMIQAPVQVVGAATFGDLDAGDVLSMDGSHVLMPGTDVDVVVNGILPRLPAGVLVHIHDVFLPDGYPAAWAWRGYNEQLAVATLLQGRGYRLLWSSHWVATRLGDHLACSVVADLPLLPGAHESSLWLEKQ